MALPSNASQSNFTDIEESAKCPIHLGLLHEPRLLPCCHAFCTKCLDDWLRSSKSSDSLLCPVCRKPYTMPGPSKRASELPPAHLHNKIIEYVVEEYRKRKGHQKHRSLSDSKTYDEEGGTTLEGILEEDVFHPETPLPTSHEDSRLCEFINRQNQSNIHMDIPTHNEPIDTSNMIPSVLQGTPNISELELLDQDTIRENMRIMSRYKICHRIIRGNSKKPSKSSISSATSCAGGKPTSRGPRHRLTDADLWQTSDKVCHLAMIDHLKQADSCTISSNSLRSATPNPPEVYSSLIMYNTHDQVENIVPIIVEKNTTFYPLFVKIYDASIFLSGLVAHVSSTPTYGILLKCTLKGDIIFRSPMYPVTSQTQPPIYGFYIDPHTSCIFAAMTSDTRIAKFQPNLTETSNSMTFTGYHPTHIIRKCDTNEIWVSCTDEGRILIVDEETGTFSLLGTEQIYSSVPSHLISTSDGKIIFLDARQNRVFWINRRNQYILIQRIIFDTEIVTGESIQSISALSDDRLLVVSKDSVFVTQPTKTANKSRRSTNCNIL